MTKKGFKFLNGDTMKSKIKLQKKLSQNTEGKINIWTIVAIILIGVLVWQFGADYLGYSSITDYLTEFDTPPETITFDYELVNPISHTSIGGYDLFTFGDGNIILDVDLENGEIPIKRYLLADYETFPAIKINTNAPYKLSQPYYVRVFQNSVSYNYHEVDNALNVFTIDESAVISSEYTFNHIFDITNDEFFLDLSNLIQDDFSFGTQSNLMHIYFYNPTGNILFEDRFLLTKEQ